MNRYTLNFSTSFFSCFCSHYCFLTSIFSVQYRMFYCLIAVNFLKAYLLCTSVGKTHYETIVTYHKIINNKNLIRIGHRHLSIERQILSSCLFLWPLNVSHKPFSSSFLVVVKQKSDSSLISHAVSPCGVWGVADFMRVTWLDSHPTDGGLVNFQTFSC